MTNLSMILAVTSAAYFIIIIEFIMPIFSAEGRFYQFTKYAALGNSTLEVLLSPINKPSVVASFLFCKASFLLVALELIPLLCLPLIALRRLCYGALIVLFILLLENPDLKSIAFQYQTMMLLMTSHFPIVSKHMDHPN